MLLYCCALMGWMAGTVHAQTYYVFEYGDQTLEARIVKYSDAGVEVVPRPGGKAHLIRWAHMSQDTLKRLQSDKIGREYAKHFIDPPPQAAPKASNKVEIVIKPVPRMTRYASGSLFASPITWFVLLLFYAGNIYAGYEIAMFRSRNKAMVAGICAAAPVIGPILFLCMPTKQEEVVVDETADVEAPPEVLAIPPTPEQIAAEAAAAAEAADTGPKLPPTAVYQRGQTTFNRRFFETKLAGYLKVVPGEAEKDMLLEFKSSRGDYVGKRFARISPNDITLLVFKGEASQEVTIPFNEIMEVKVRHKDAA